MQYISNFIFLPYVIISNTHHHHHIYYFTNPLRLQQYFFIKPTCPTHHNIISVCFSLFNRNIYKLLPSHADCLDEEYDCDDDTCIASDLECNGRTNCKFLKDEADCEVSAHIYTFSHINSDRIFFAGCGQQEFKSFSYNNCSVQPYTGCYDDCISNQLHTKTDSWPKDYKGEYKQHKFSSAICHFIFTSNGKGHVCICYVHIRTSLIEKQSWDSRAI